MASLPLLDCMLVMLAKFQFLEEGVQSFDSEVFDLLVVDLLLRLMCPKVWWSPPLPRHQFHLLDGALTRPEPLPCFQEADFQISSNQKSLPSLVIVLETEPTSSPEC